MADVPSPAIGQNGQLIPTTTVTRPTTDVNEKQMSGVGVPAYQDFLDANAARVAAQESIGGEAPTAEELDAELAQSQANATGSEADEALAAAKLKRLPDPFEKPNASQSIDAELSQVPASPVQASPIQPAEQGGMDQMMAQAHGTAADAPAPPPESKPLSYAEAQDRTNLFNAENKAREQELLRQKLVELQAQKEQDFKRIQGDIDAAAAEHLKAVDSRSRWEEMGTFQKLLRILGNAMGAYASIVGGGPNPVQEMINNEMRNDLEIKKMRVAGAIKKYEAAGARPEQLQKLYEEQMKDALAMHKANVEQLDLTSQKLLARYPQAQKAAAMVTANLRADAAKEQATFALANSGRTVENKGQRVQTVEGKGEGRMGPSESEAKLALLGKSMKDELVAIRKGAKLSSDDLDTLQGDTLRAESADKAAESGGQLSGIGVGIARKLGAAPKSRYASLPAPKQQTANAWDNAVEKYSRVLTGAGMPADEARRMARQNAPVAGDTPEQVEFKTARMEREADRFISLGGPKAAQRMAPPQAGSSIPAAVAPSREVRAAYTAAKMILENPKKFGPERVKKAQAAKANYDRRYGGANE